VFRISSKNSAVKNQWKGAYNWEIKKKQKKLMSSRSTSKNNNKAVDRHQLKNSDKKREKAN
jgi:hypothetical protein